MLTGNMENQTVVEIDNNELKKMIEDEKDFVLIIKLEGCSSCESFQRDILNPFIKKTFVDIYSINAHEVDLMYNVVNAPKYKLAPNIQIYNNGKSIFSADYSDKKQYFKDVDSFEELLNEFTLMPKIIGVSESYLDNMIENKESFVLYIGWYRCGDCVSLMDNVLLNYINAKQTNQIIYYLEVDEYRKNKPSALPNLDNATPEDIMFYEYYVKWLEFAKKYNFADYEDGKVPTLQYYELGQVKEMIVYKNDVIEDNVIIKSYYKDLIGQNLSSEELDNYHKDKVILFLEKYYK